MKHLGIKSLSLIHNLKREQVESPAPEGRIKLKKDSKLPKSILVKPPTRVMEALRNLHFLTGENKNSLVSASLWHTLCRPKGLTQIKSFSGLDKMVIPYKKHHQIDPRKPFRLDEDEEDSIPTPKEDHKLTQKDRNKLREWTHQKRSVSKGEEDVRSR